MCDFILKNFPYQIFAKIVDSEKVSVNSVRRRLDTSCIFAIGH